MTIIKAMLRAGLFAALMTMPGLASAEGIPDHNEAEEKEGDMASEYLPATPRGVPDHAEAESRGGDSALGAQHRGMGPEIPDHEEAESRGAVEK
jgi:hypothetical protein